MALGLSSVPGLIDLIFVTLGSVLLEMRSKDSWFGSDLLSAVWIVLGSLP